MGESTFVKPNPKTGDKISFLRNLKFDWPLLLIVAALLVFGLLMLYSSSWDASWINSGHANTTELFQKQVRYALLGILLGGILSMVDYHIYRRGMVIMILGILILLIATLFSEKILGSSRALFNGSFRPSEFAKLAIILYISYWLSNRKDVLKDFSEGVVPLLLIIVTFTLLIGAQPDFSAAATIDILVIVLFFLAGGTWKHFLSIIASVLLGAILAIATISSLRTRINNYWETLRDPTKGSHSLRNAEAVIKGRFFGVGLGNSTTKSTGLPLPYNDSIFAVVAEETGIFGGTIVVVLFTLLAWRSLEIARKAPDQWGSLLAFGLGFWIWLEAILNIGYIVGILPSSGNSLPFFSYGGTNMVASMAAIGILINISKQGYQKKNTERSETHASSDMRGGNRWWSVSGSNRQ